MAKVKVDAGICKGLGQYETQAGLVGGPDPDSVQ